MKIDFSVFNEDTETSRATLINTKCIQTDWSIDEIDRHFDITEGFHYEVQWGQTIAFWEIYSYCKGAQYFINKIDSIPKSSKIQSRVKYPILTWVEESDGYLLGELRNTKKQKLYFCEFSREELGLSGYSAITLWMASHPLEMVFIAGQIWDMTKWIFKKLFSLLFRKSKSITLQRRELFYVKRFFRNFTTFTKVSASDAQIISMRKLQTGLFELIIRTGENEEYKVKCDSKGSIQSFTRKSLDKKHNLQHIRNR